MFEEFKYCMICWKHGHVNNECNKNMDKAGKSKKRKNFSKPNDQSKEAHGSSKEPMQKPKVDHHG